MKRIIKTCQDDEKLLYIELNWNGKQTYNVEVWEMRTNAWGFLTPVFLKEQKRFVGEKEQAEKYFYRQCYTQ